MTRTPPFLDEPTTTREAIMKATYDALCQHGYADLTIQHIGDEFEKSKSLLYHHYDSKDDLMLDFLDFMLERFEDRIPYPQGQSVAEYLDSILERVLVAPSAEKPEDFARAMVELRAQAAHDPEFREHFTRSDHFFRKQLARIVREGTEQGVFQQVDSRRTAAMIHAIVLGTMTQRVTTDDDLAGQIRAEVDRYLQRCVLVADGD
ncbi:MAG: TetR/AcrR family transcriptional regulator [Haloarculaceae archaeon]